MDSTYYQNHLKYLYDSTANNQEPVYNVDNLLYSYTSRNTFTNNVTPSLFFNEITQVSLNREEPDDVRTRVNTADSVDLPRLRTTNTFTEITTNNEVKIDITRGSQMSTEAMLQSIAQGTDFVTRTESAILGLNNDITKSHTAFDQYMLGILTAVCAPCFARAVKSLSSNIPPNAPQNLEDAINDVALRNYNQLHQLYTVVAMKVMSSFQEVVIPLTNIRTDTMADFNNANESFKRPLYYQLRSKIADELVITPPILMGNETEDFTIMYINKILADIFIKSCYPVIHYLFIDAMMKKYAQAGDFINIRLALLAKIFYTYYFIDYINQNIYAADSALQSDSGKKATYDSLFAQINTNLNNYLISINNIDISTQPGQNALANILKSLHDLSNQVVIKSENINELKGKITEHQLALRSIIANVDIERGKFGWKAFEFWFILTILLIVVLASGVLLFLNKPQFVFYIAGATLTIIIIAKLIELINSFITKN